MSTLIASLNKVCSTKLSSVKFANDATSATVRAPSSDEKCKQLIWLDLEQTYCTHNVLYINLFYIDYLTPYWVIYRYTGAMASPETFRALLAANALPQRTESSHKTKSLCENINQFIYKMAHEPSLAGYRIQEHVYKAVPALYKEHPNVITTAQKLDGVMFDLIYTGEFLNKLDDSIQNSAQARETISELASKVSSMTSRAGRLAES